MKQFNEWIKAKVADWFPEYDWLHYSGLKYSSEQMEEAFKAGMLAAADIPERIETDHDITMEMIAVEIRQACEQESDG